jgi:hypothetical protein
VFSVALSPSLSALAPTLPVSSVASGAAMPRPHPVRLARGLVPALVCSGPLMRQGRSPSRSLSAQELCKVTVLVLKDCAERIRQFAHELRGRQDAGPFQCGSNGKVLVRAPSWWSLEIVVPVSRTLRKRSPECSPLTWRGSQAVELRNNGVQPG